MLKEKTTYVSIMKLIGLEVFKCLPWWRHQMETFSALLTHCAGNSPVTGEFPAQRPVTRSFDVFFDLRLNKRLSKQSWGWWFETPSSSLWRYCNDIVDMFRISVTPIKHTKQNQIIANKGKHRAKWLKHRFVIRQSKSGLDCRYL